MATALLLVALFFRPIVMLFLSSDTALDSEQFISLCRILVTIMATWCMSDAANVIAGGSLKGAGDTRFVMFAGTLAVFGLWVPSVIAVAKFSPSVVNLWLTLPLYVLVLAVTFVTRWMRGKWRRIELIDHSTREI